MPPPEQEPGSIVDYLEALERWRFPPEGPLSAVADDQYYRGWRRLVVRAVPEVLIAPARVVVTRARMALGSGRRLRAVPPGARVHLGCGERRIEGWLNVDLAGGRADVVWDLRRPLPLAPGSVAAVFHEHFLEHLPFAAAVASLREAHRLLAPGGVLRIGVPDFREHFRSYVEGDGVLGALRPGRPTPLLALNELVYAYGHCSLWDLETFQVVLGEIGFAAVDARPFGVSRISPAPDSEHRRHATLYVEAVKAR